MGFGFFISGIAYIVVAGIYGLCMDERCNDRIRLANVRGKGKRKSSRREIHVAERKKPVERDVFFKTFTDNKIGAFGHTKYIESFHKYKEGSYDHQKFTKNFDRGCSYTRRAYKR